MKWNVALLMGLFATVLPNLQAQRGGAGIGRATGHSRAGRLPGRSGFSHTSGNRWDYRSGFDGYSPYSGYWGGFFDYPYYGYYPNYGPYAGIGYSAVIVAAPQQPEPASPPPPPPPAPSPAVHEYSWPDSPNDGATAFAIIAKNGTLYRAIAVWIQDGRLCFFTPEGISQNVLLNDIDREHTTQLNSELKLKLPLPNSTS